MNPVASASILPQAHLGLRHPLDCIFAARSVAVVGATEKAGTVGRTVLWNLMSTPFGGPIYPVSPSQSSILGIKSCPSLKALPERVDLVVITTPAETVPAIIDQCADPAFRESLQAHLEKAKAKPGRMPGGSNR